MITKLMASISRQSIVESLFHMKEQQIDGKVLQNEANNFQENGFGVIPNFLSEEQCENFIKYTEKMAEKYSQNDQKNLVFESGKLARGVSFLETGDIIHLFYEKNAKVLEREMGEKNVRLTEKINKIGHAMHDLDPYYEKLSYQPKIAQILKSIGYQRPSLVQSMYIFKGAKIGDEVLPHTDNTYLITNPLSTVGFWFALHDATVENGCLWGVPGSHRQATQYFMKRNQQGTDTYYEGDQPDYDLTRGIPIEAKRGTLVFFDGNFVHYSKTNYSTKPRHAYTLHFVDSIFEWDSANWLQRRPHIPFRDFYSHTEYINQEY